MLTSDVSSQHMQQFERTAIGQEGRKGDERGTGSFEMSASQSPHSEIVSRSCRRGSTATWSQPPGGNNMDDIVAN